MESERQTCVVNDLNNFRDEEKWRNEMSVFIVEQRVLISGQYFSHATDWHFWAEKFQEVQTTASILINLITARFPTVTI